MNNEIQRKLTSLTLMTIMLAGGMAIAFPEMEPAHALNPNLIISAEEVGNFAGIQVIEIVVSDPDRSDTGDHEGTPNVTFGDDDVYMAQATDGSWYAYVANNNAVEDYTAITGVDIDDIWDSEGNGVKYDLDTDAENIYVNATTFLDGSKDINDQYNNDPDAEKQWPFIQTYDLTDDTKVTITYGSGVTAQSTSIDYDYDDTKDITLDRNNNRYPLNSQVFITSDDSLLNLSPTADEIWIFNGTDTKLVIGDGSAINTDVNWTGAGFENGPISFDNDDGVLSFANSAITDVYREESNNIILQSSGDGDGLFVNWDSKNEAGLTVVTAGTASISYNGAHSVLLEYFDGALAFAAPAIDEWLSGIELGISLQDVDRNLSSKSSETLSIGEVETPYIKVGSPIHLDDPRIVLPSSLAVTSQILDNKVMNVTSTSHSANITVEWPYLEESNAGTVRTYVNYDFTNIGGTAGTFYAGSQDGTLIADNLPGANGAIGNGTFAGIHYIDMDMDTSGTLTTPVSGYVYLDVLSFGQEGALTSGNGEINDNVPRVNDAIYRLELEESDDNTANFEGTVEYIMINQLNVFDPATYAGIATSGDDIVMIVNDDMDGSDSITVSYKDLDSTGSEVIISTQEAANTHTGKIELDSTSYSSGNTITVTLTDVDLNTNSDTIQVYDIDSGMNWVGNANVWLSQFLINDVPYDGKCDNSLSFDNTGFTLTETDDASGIFIGTLGLPSKYCPDATGSNSTNGLDLDFEYQDYSDASGKPNESSDSASIRSNTGSVSLDRTVYPVPFTSSQFETYDGAKSPLGGGDVIVTISINDPDFNISASGEDTLDVSVLSLEVKRGSDYFVVSLGNDDLVETDPESGIFEIDVSIPQNDYSSTTWDFVPGSDKAFIHQGDILTVTYEDPTDASGDINTVTDSATFDLRNAVLQSDKSVYLIGSDAIITLIEPDLNLDSGTAETWSLDLINWDSDAGSANLSDAVFDASTSGIRETGDGTGIFQVVIAIPDNIDGDVLERGEQITLEYQDQGPAGADFVSDDDEDISLDIFTSNFGATVELDQKVYTWTDKVYITIVAPDHNFDSDSIDEIGTDGNGEINIATRENELEFYKLVETGTDTGIFSGELILIGYEHDADGDGTLDAGGDTRGSGPTGGYIESGNDGGLTVSFEFSDGETVLGSSLIRWNIGEVQWLEASYPASGSGVLRVIDPDMNLNPEAVDSFDVNVWSDTAAGGISIRATETNEATGIFEGTVFFTTSGSSSGSRLAISEGDTVTAEYEDNTLPDPYSSTQELDVTATTLIGTLIPPLERAPAANLRTVDAFGNNLDTVQVDQQVQVQADIANGQNKSQEFAYLVQIQDVTGVTVSLSWITGSLSSDQSFSPAVSWIPQDIGEYTATVFVWESVDNPTALSPSVSTTISVNN